jgi:hypothetical protein
MRSITIAEAPPPPLQTPAYGKKLIILSLGNYIIQYLQNRI